MPTRSVPESQGRETRILLLIVAISIALLLLLARLRYPAADLPVIAPTQAPLVGTSGPRGFEDLSQRLSSLLATVSPRVLVVEVEPATPPPRRPLQEVEPQPGIAVHVKPDIAVMHVPRGFRPRSAVGAGVEVLATDDNREVAVLRVSPNLDAFSDRSVEPFAGMSFVGVVFATRGGPTVQPGYVGRVSPVSDTYWAGGLLDLGPIPTPPDGAALFSTEGQFLGFTSVRQGTVVLTPAQALQDLVALRVPGGVPAQ